MMVGYFGCLPFATLSIPNLRGHISRPGQISGCWLLADHRTPGFGENFGIGFGYYPWRFDGQQSELPLKATSSLSFESLACSADLGEFFSREPPDSPQVRRKLVSKSAWAY